MSRYLRILCLAVLVSIVATGARAADEEFRDRRPEPGQAIGAAFINVVFLPLRLIVTTADALLGGFTGFMTGGNRQAAWDVWNLAGGDQIITPGMLSGRERFRFDSRDVPSP
jgi:hypothetical protein